MNAMFANLLKNARWMDGFVWFVVTGFAWLTYETVYLGAPLTIELLLKTALIWGLAAIGYALLSGYFAEKAKKEKQ